jgi:hypothetical protein
MSLYDRLRSAGIADDEAQSIVRDHAAETVADVDTDRLTKAMEAVAGTFGDAAPTSAVDTAVQEASDIVDAVTRGADALLEEQREQYQSLAKGLLALGDEVRELRAKLSTETATIAKSLGHIADEPLARKSVSVEAVPAPGDIQNTTADYSTVLNKAIAELKSTDDTDRQAELRRAVSMLESGFTASHISTTFGL